MQTTPLFMPVLDTFCQGYLVNLNTTPLGDDWFYPEFLTLEACQAEIDEINDGRSGDDKFDYEILRAQFKEGDTNIVELYSGDELYRAIPWREQAEERGLEPLPAQFEYLVPIMQNLKDDPFKENYKSCVISSGHITEDDSWVLTAERNDSTSLILERNEGWVLKLWGDVYDARQSPLFQQFSKAFQHLVILAIMHSYSAMEIDKDGPDLGNDFEMFNW